MDNTSNNSKLNKYDTIPEFSSIFHFNTNHIHILKGDSGATSHYLSLETINALKNVLPNRKNP